MGRGTYLGGSTIIGPRSGWFTGVGQPPATMRSAKTSSPISKKEAHRIHYLHAVARAEVAEKTPPPLSKKAKATLQTLVTAAGGPSAWAKAQPEYTKFRDRAKRRQENNSKLGKQAKYLAPVRAAAAEQKTTEEEASQHLAHIRAAIAQVNLLMKEIADRQSRLEALLHRESSVTT